MLQALSVDGGDGWASLYLSTLYAQSGRVADAFTAARRAVELDPDVPLFHAQLADCHAREGRMDDAERSYLAGLARDRKDFAVNVRYAHFLETVGRVDEATRLFRLALEVDPNSTMATDALKRLARLT